MYHFVVKIKTHLPRTIECVNFTNSPTEPRWKNPKLETSISSHILITLSPSFRAIVIPYIRTIISEMKKKLQFVIFVNESVYGMFKNIILGIWI